MDRLFDMMTMTVKQQMMTVDEPRQILDVTINHLNGIKEIVGASKDIVSTVNYAYELVCRLQQIRHRCDCTKFANNCL